MSQENFKMLGLEISGEKLDKINGEKQEKENQEWQDGQGIFCFKTGEGRDALPTDIDIEIVVLDYNNNEDLIDPEYRETVVQKEPVLVILGIGEDIEVGKGLLQELARQGRKVVGFSLPGNGDSGDPNKDWRVNSNTGKWKENFDDYSALINKIIDQLRKDKKISSTGKLDLVGHSLGGMIAAEFTTKNLDKVGNLNLIAPGGYKTKIMNPAHIYPGTVVEFTAAQFKEVIGNYIRSEKEEVPDIISSMWWKNFAKTDTWQKSNTEQLNELITNGMDSDLTEETPGKLARLKQRFWEAEVILRGNLEKRLCEIPDEIPVRIIVGERDKLFPPNDYKEVAERLKDGGREVTVEIVEDTGHYGCILQSDKYAKIINK